MISKGTCITASGFTRDVDFISEYLNEFFYLKNSLKMQIYIIDVLQVQMCPVPVVKSSMRTTMCPFWFLANLVEALHPAFTVSTPN